LFTIKFIYKDDTYLEFNHIIKIEYQGYDKFVLLEGNDILSCKLPSTKDVYMFSENASYTAYGPDVKSVSIVRE
jgi:hypothetical protein